ncbi:hypothetical protein N9954_00415 [Maribacter sp.]|nr:hypothetical protein [Maribacter sp.]
MEENIKVDSDYLTAFNLGYELAKELNLTSPMFKNVSSISNRMNAMQSGMEQYSKEMELKKKKGSSLGLNFTKGIPKEHRDKGKGYDFSI